MVGGGYDWQDNVAGGGEQSRKDLDGQYAGVSLSNKCLINVCFFFLLRNNADCVKVYITYT